MICINEMQSNKLCNIIIIIFIYYIYFIIIYIDGVDIKLYRLLSSFLFSKDNKITLTRIFLKIKSKSKFNW